MSVESVASVVGHYRYWILIPLSLIEGPTVALVAGTLASFGRLNVYAAFGILVVKDMLVDGAYYYLGRFAGNRRFVVNLLRKARITPADVERVRDLWMTRGLRAMFVGKLSWGLSPAFLAAAGIVDLPARNFFTYAVAVAVLQYAILLCIGYYFGHAFGTVSRAVRVVQTVTAAAAVVIIFYVRSRLRS